MDRASRLIQLAVRLKDGGKVDSRYVMQHYGVSWGIAKRDLVTLETAMPVKAEIGPHGTKTLWLLAN